MMDIDDDTNTEARCTEEMKIDVPSEIDWRHDVVLPQQFIDNETSKLQPFSNQNICTHRVWSQIFPANNPNQLAEKVKPTTLQARASISASNLRKSITVHCNDIGIISKVITNKDIYSTFRTIIKSMPSLHHYTAYDCTSNTNGTITNLTKNTITLYTRCAHKCYGCKTVCKISIPIDQIAARKHVDVVFEFNYNGNKWYCDLHHDGVLIPTKMNDNDKAKLLCAELTPRQAQLALAKQLLSTHSYNPYSCNTPLLSRDAAKSIRQRALVRSYAHPELSLSLRKLRDSYRNEQQYNDLSEYYRGYIHSLDENIVSCCVYDYKDLLLASACGKDSERSLFCDSTLDLVKPHKKQQSYSLTIWIENPNQKE
eukprot:203318_1